MLKRPAKKELTVEQQASILNASREQTGKAQVIKSYDSDYPVFEVPVNQKLLVYIPNHVIQNPDGSIDIRADKFAAHPYQTGREFGNIRCTNGVDNVLDLDGTCPACDAVSESWELYNFEFEALAKSRGFAEVNEDAKTALKEERKKLLEARTMKQADVWLTFPIVVIDCEVGADGKPTTKAKINADGTMSGKTYWYSIREKSYIDKWISPLDSVEIDGETPTHPAGLWAVLNFTYQSTDGTHNKMQSAKNLKVSYKNPDPSLAPVAQYFDAQTAEWTPEKAMEVVVLDAIRDKAESCEAVDTIMKGTRDRIALYKTSVGVQTAGNAPQLGATNAQAALADFGATPVADTAQTPVGVAPQGAPITSEMPTNIGVQ